jgi:hypothetical protein
MDVVTAYLNGNLDEEIFMEPPTGFPPKIPTQVWHLKKSLYGLKQAGREWNKHTHNELTNLGYHRIHSDYTVYIRFDEDGEVRIIVLYVDDLLLLAALLHIINKMKEELKGTEERFIGY